MNKKANSRSEFLFNKKLLNSKRSQSQIITTVLIILLVLAAIVIVWQVVQSSVRGGAEQIETQSDCLGLNLVVVSVNKTAISLRRDPGATSQTSVDAILFVEGQNKGVVSTGLKELDSKINNSIGSFNAGDKVQLAGRLGGEGGTLCPLGPKKEIVDGAL